MHFNSRQADESPESFWSIYALIDPRDGEVRYVGISLDASKRLKAHLKDGRATAKTAWLKDLKSSGEAPRIKILDIAGSKEEGVGKERFWIQYYRDRNGNLLTNSDPGGAGVFSEKARKRIGERTRDAILTRTTTEKEQRKERARESMKSVWNSLPREARAAWVAHIGCGIREQRSTHKKARQASPLNKKRSNLLKAKQAARELSSAILSDRK